MNAPGDFNVFQPAYQIQATRVKQRKVLNLPGQAVAAAINVMIDRIGADNHVHYIKPGIQSTGNPAVYNIIRLETADKLGSTQSGADFANSALQCNDFVFTEVSLQKNKAIAFGLLRIGKQLFNLVKFFAHGNNKADFAH